MNLTDQQKKLEYNYRSTDGPGCIHCHHCDWSKYKMKTTINGIIESECMLLKIKVDENHLCD